MKRAGCVVIHACSWLAGHTGTSIIALAVVWMASTPGPAWGQSAWPSYPNNNAISVTSGGSVGIGTSNPGDMYSHLEVWDSNLGSSARISISTTGIGIPGFQWLSGVNWKGGIYKDGSTDDIQIYTANNGSIPRLVVQNGGNVGVGTTNPQYLLSVKGAIGGEEFIVTNTGWSDYVFQPGYRLRPLSEVNAYIQANHHLPGIPSETEVKETGVSVGEMQSKLLAKIEELTLHMIQQERENQRLRGRIARLEKGAAGATPAAVK